MSAPDPGPAAQWARMEEIFQAALDLDPEARPGYLAKACAGDLGLLREVTSLLESADQRLNRVTDAISQTARSVMEAAVPQPGDRVGAYQLGRKLGEGGMGAVFLAERADGAFTATVAIKLLRPGTAGRARLTERLRAEQRIMAGLAHENIARMLDAGFTEDGAPYVVMEFVDGIPLDEYCAARCLDVRARCALFRALCSAVAYAHRRLVIHRDIKPVNILVTAGGTPKLLDFGIAKLLREDDAAPGLTQAGERLMTPEYASPELIRGEPATTSVDIFALGTVLYELLAGRHPFRKESQTRWELERTICEFEAARPSAVEGSPISRMPRHERLDLDSIVSKALARSPAARYATADQFDADLERFLHGQPVAAARVTAAYRLGKFVRRHKWGVSLGAASAAGLIAVAVGMGLLAARISREQIKAERISSFLKGMFANADPNVTGGEKLTLREVLDRGSAGIARELQTEPEVALELIETMATAYQHLTEYERSEAMYRAALDTQTRLYGRASIQVSRTLRQLGDVQREQGRLMEAEKSLVEAVAIQQKLLPAGDLALAHSWNNLGLVVQSEGKLEEAESYFRRAVDTGMGKPEARTALLTWQSNLGGVLTARARYAEAEPVLRGVLESRRRLLGETHPQVIRVMSRLALLVHLRGRYGEAETLAREAAGLAYRKLGPGSLDYFSSQSMLGTALRSQGRLRESAEAQTAAIDAAAARVGPSHIQTSIYRNELAKVWEAEGRHREARAIYAETLDSFRKSGSAFAGDSLAGLGRTETALGNYARAGAALNEALEKRRKVDGAIHPQVAAILSSMAELKRATGMTEEARGLFDEAIRIDMQVLGAEHPETIELQKRSALR